MEKKEEKRSENNSDTQRGAMSDLPTYSHTPISLRTKERQLLRYLLYNKGKRFNVRDYARNIAKIPRSSVYDYLDKLENLGFINRELGDSQISEKGIILLESQENMTVGGSRSECREEGKLSTHFHKFHLQIKDTRNFLKSRLEKLKPNGIKENKLHNLHQVFVYFDDATIIINPKQVIMTLYDVISDNVEDSDMKCLSRAVEYAKKFMSVGLETEGIMLEEGHWARIKSVLSDFIYDKVDERYFLKLDNGNVFYIDHSPDKNGIPKREDETNDKVVRERVDNFMTQIMKNDFDLHDIDKIKESLGFLTKLECSRLQDQIEENKLKRKQLEVQDSYSIKDYRPTYLG
jgi:DNA-binding MarR family transcriptional regulator